MGSKTIFGYIYKITNKVNGRVYIGQTKRSFKERYGGLSIKSVYKNSPNKDLKSDIATYFDDVYWCIEPEYDIAYSYEELNEKEHGLVMQYIWDYMPNKKRCNLGVNSEDSNKYELESYIEFEKYLKRFDITTDYLDSNKEMSKIKGFVLPFRLDESLLGSYFYLEDNYLQEWYTWFTGEILKRVLPPVLYNQKIPSLKKEQNKNKRYIYMGVNMPIVFYNKIQFESYMEGIQELRQDEDGFVTRRLDTIKRRGIENISRYPFHLVTYWDDGGFFYIKYSSNLRPKGRVTVPRISDVSRCYIYKTSPYKGSWGVQNISDEGADEYTPLVRYNGVSKFKEVRFIYRPFRCIKIERVQVR